MSAIPQTVIPVGAKINSGGVLGAMGVSLPGAQGDPGEKGPQGDQGDIALPPGFIAPFGGRVAPAYWLLCDGGMFLIADYPDLFAAIGHAFTAFVFPELYNHWFQVPDCRARTLIGSGALDIEPGWAPWRGWKGGEINHRLTEAEMPWHYHHLNFDHYHSVSVNNHGHGFNQGWHDHGPHTHNVYVCAPYQTQVSGGNSFHDFLTPHWYAGAESSGAGANWSGGSVADAGRIGGWTNYMSEQAHNWHWRGSSWWGAGTPDVHENIQPSLAVSYIIKI